MKFSQRFGRLSGTGIQHAPSAEGKTDEQYREEGWLEIDRAAPADKEGSRWLPCGFEAADGKIRPVWREVPVREKTRTYSKYLAILAMTEIGIWRSVREWLDTTVLAGTQTKLGELFDAAQAFRSDDPNFKPVLSDLKAKFGISDSEAAEILRKCETT